jgi:hypothetical protein
MCGALILLGACLYRIIVFRKVKNVAKYIPIVHLLLLVWGIGKELRKCSCCNGLSIEQLSLHSNKGSGR